MLCGVLQIDTSRQSSRAIYESSSGAHQFRPSPDDRQVNLCPRTSMSHWPQ